MFDEPLPPADPRTIDEMDFLPFDEGSDAGEEATRRADPVDPQRFLYLGQGLTAPEFAAYVETYDFGAIPPDYVVLHHTANPCTHWAQYPGGSVWDANEGGLSAEQIKARRLGKLTAIKEYYRTNPSYFWDRGPHLFIDDQYIWLFTPMRHVGIHAAEGNSITQGGRLHYSIGIEVVGYYENVQWPEPVQHLVGHAVAVLKRRLGTFDLRYTKFAGGISSHRDYNKPQCPGKAITEDFYIRVLNDGWQRLNTAEQRFSAVAPQPLSLDSPIIGPPTGNLDQAVAYVKAQLAADSEYKNDVDKIMGYYWQYAPDVGVDPFLAAAQCIFETDALRSQWAGRPRRNPAGLGVRQEGGLQFASWEESVQAHIGQLLAFALRDDQANAAQRQMMSRNPRHAHITPQQRGAAPTIRGLSSTWTGDAAYAEKLVNRARSMET